MLILLKVTIFGGPNRIRGYQWFFVFVVLTRRRVCFCCYEGTPSNTRLHTPYDALPSARPGRGVRRVRCRR
jgi:hypothetical protein